VTLEELSFDDRLLHLVVFGPGFGESIALRIPPGRWLIVDSLRRQDVGTDFNRALELLRLHAARPAAIALTHPHADHGQGFLQLLDARETESPVGCALPFLTPPPQRRRSSDAATARDTGTVQAVLNRIADLWRREPASRWVLGAGNKVGVGDGVVQTLHPPRDEPVRRDLNRSSSPMLVRWQACDVLLGADLTRPGWRLIESKSKLAARLPAANVLKASHHGSRNAQHRVAIGVPPAVDRPVIVTPFNKGHQLPNYADDHGIEQLLRCNAAVGVTSVAAQVRGRRTPRAQMLPPREHFGNDLVLSYEGPTTPPANAWIAVSLSADGQIAQAGWGDAAGIVVP
jgi:hypothetical protein